MTVKELIKELLNCPMDSKVVVVATNYNDYSNLVIEVDESIVVDNMEIDQSIYGDQRCKIIVPLKTETN